MRRIPVQAQPLGHKLSICLGREKRQVRVGAEQRKKSFSIKVIGMVVAGGGEIYEIQLPGFDRKFRHTDVGLVGAGVLLGQRIREVGVDQEKSALLSEKKAALPQPPEMEAPLVGRSGRDIPQ